MLWYRLHEHTRALETYSTVEVLGTIHFFGSGTGAMNVGSTTAMLFFLPSDAYSL